MPRDCNDQVNHESITRDAFNQAGLGGLSDWAAGEVSGVDKLPGSQNVDTEHSPWHAMCAPGQNPNDVDLAIQQMVSNAIEKCDWNQLMMALHALQDSTSRGHKGCQTWDGHVSREHLSGDMFPTKDEYNDGLNKSQALLRKFKEKCMNCGAK